MAVNDLSIIYRPIDRQDPASGQEPGGAGDRESTRAEGKEPIFSPFRPHGILSSFLPSSSMEVLRDVLGVLGDAVEEG